MIFIYISHTNLIVYYYFYCVYYIFIFVFFFVFGVSSYPPVKLTRLYGASLAPHGNRLSQDGVRRYSPAGTLISLASPPLFAQTHLLLSPLYVQFYQWWYMYIWKPSLNWVCVIYIIARLVRLSSGAVLLLPFLTDLVQSDVATVAPPHFSVGKLWATEGYVLIFLFSRIILLIL